MARKTLSGQYSPINPDKYVGKYPIQWRSTWELTICRMCDTHPSIMQWASESLKIPYFNPLTQRQTVYVPDFMVEFEDKKNNRRVEVWEIKPKKESILTEAKSDRDKAALAVNSMKWKAAQEWCNARGAVFRVINEDSIFRNHKGRR